MPAPASVPALRARHRDDTAHSSYVEAMAARLFIGAEPFHRVSPVYLPLLQAGALLHNVGLLANPADHHLRGRDIVAGEGLRGFSDEERDAVACIVAFHRRRVTPERERLWLGLPVAMQEAVLKLAALVRIADGLDCSLDQSTFIVDVRGKKAPRVLVGGGKFTGWCVKRAGKKSDLWETVTGLPFRFGESGKTERSWRPPVDARQTLAESAPRILNGHLAGVVAHSRTAGGLRAVDPRHDMRVSLRRFRAALRLYQRMWPEGDLDRLTTELRWFGELLGAVRDKDVSVEWLEARRMECPRRFRQELRALKERTIRQRRDELRRLLPALRSERYAAMLQYASYVTEGIESRPEELTDRAGRKLARQIRSTFGRHVERMVAKSCGVTEEDSERLHGLRIEARRMRYTVEAWYAALGPGRKALQKHLLAVQDALGDIHDADVRLHETFADVSDDVREWLRESIAGERRRAWEQFSDSWPRLLACMTESHLDGVIPSD